MGLSEFEQLQLDNIARGLQEQDPRLATLMSLQSLDGRRWKGTKRGVLAAVAGLGLLLASFPLGSLTLGVVGFLLMGGGTYWATLFMDDRPPLRFIPRNQPHHSEKDKEQS
ncbi:DUF3040 domain-containing protein [Paenarthrobacter sp. NPDC092416]|uniref:DUF3040 domain-containing protein n=1 Tax=Paenarthrobacter sp. NPDC092416 TaxID=3364386 RepID=UPI003821E13B